MLNPFNYFLDRIISISCPNKFPVFLQDCKKSSDTLFLLKSEINCLECWYGITLFLLTGLANITFLGLTGFATIIIYSTPFHHPCIIINNVLIQKEYGANHTHLWRFRADSSSKNHHIYLIWKIYNKLVVALLFRK